MVEMKVREEDVQLDRRILLHRHAEWPHARAGVEHERVPTRQANLYTRRVAAVFDGAGPRYRDGAPTSPHPRAHQASRSPDATSQNTVTTPCISRAAPNSGYAVTSYSRRTPL